jgi:hypothetical protein
MKPSWVNLVRHRLTLLLGELSLSVAAAFALCQPDAVGVDSNLPVL